VLKPEDQVEDGVLNQKSFTRTLGIDATGVRLEVIVLIDENVKIRLRHQWPCPHGLEGQPGPATPKSQGG
jgi:hypothetical protein